LDRQPQRPRASSDSTDPDLSGRYCKLFWLQPAPWPPQEAAESETNIQLNLCVGELRGRHQRWPHASPIRLPQHRTKGIAGKTPNAVQAPRAGDESRGPVDSVAHIKDYRDQTRCIRRRSSVAAVCEESRQIRLNGIQPPPGIEKEGNRWIGRCLNEIIAKGNSSASRGDPENL